MVYKEIILIPDNNYGYQFQVDGEIIPEDQIDEIRYWVKEEDLIKLRESITEENRSDARYIEINHYCDP